MLEKRNAEYVSILELVTAIEKLPTDKKMQALGFIQGIAASIPDKPISGATSKAG